MLPWAKIEADEIAQYWPAVRPMVKRALDKGHGEYTTASILTAIAESRMQLWVATDEAKPRAALVTEVVDCPDLRLLHVPALSGVEMDEWFDMLGQIITPWAKDQGCIEVRGTCTPGMGKVLRQRGWKHRYDIMGLPI